MASVQCFSESEGRFYQLNCGIAQECCDGKCCDTDYDYGFYTRWYFWTAAVVLLLLLAAAILISYCRVFKQRQELPQKDASTSRHRLLSCSRTSSLDEDEKQLQSKSQSSEEKYNCRKSLHDTDPQRICTADVNNETQPIIQQQQDKIV